MEGVKELVIDASAQLLMDEISNILNNVKVKRGRRSFETIQNQPIIKIKINYGSTTILLR